jgi:hypothetical protein
VLQEEHVSLDNGIERLNHMNEKIGSHVIDWKKSQYAGSNIKTPVNEITFVLKRRYPSHSRRQAPFFKVSPTPENGIKDPVFLPIYKMGFRRAWKAALKANGAGQMRYEMVRFARRAPPIENYLITN